MAENGRLPDSDLAPIHQGRLRKDAAAAYNAMNVEARRNGVELRPTGSRSSYRTYQQQVDLYNDYLNGTGNLAARPGTSNHGWGLAVDFATQQMRSMVDRIGRKYGWAKDWSDAPSEWWHLRWREGVWSGPDPGPTGGGAPAPGPPPPEDYEDVAVAENAQGHLHVFVEAKDGSIWFTYQRRGESNWNGGQPGKAIAGLTRFAPAPGK